MSEYGGAIYIGSILLEVNRWTKDKEPTYLVSDWLPKFIAAGFDGIELWENHAAKASADEIAALSRASLPISIFNSYCGFEREAGPARERAVALAETLGAGGLKFNVGPDPALWDEYMAAVVAWGQEFPPACRLLCECHPGTVVETPEAAARFFSQPGTERFEMMAHAFGQDSDSLAAWFDALGGRITHIHCQMRDADRQCIGLADDPARAEATLAGLRAAGFAGSFTLEFTRGTRAPDEHIEGLWEAALSDLQFIRERW